MGIGKVWVRVCVSVMKKESARVESERVAVSLRSNFSYN